jgi:hypothetical protein
MLTKSQKSNLKKEIKSNVYLNTKNLCDSNDFDYAFSVIDELTKTYGESTITLNLHSKVFAKWVKYLLKINNIKFEFSINVYSSVFKFKSLKDAVKFAKENDKELVKISLNTSSKSFEDAFYANTYKTEAGILFDAYCNIR